MRSGLSKGWNRVGKLLCFGIKRKSYNCICWASVIILKPPLRCLYQVAYWVCQGVMWAAILQLANTVVCGGVAVQHHMQ